MFLRILVILVIAFTLHLKAADSASEEESGSDITDTKKGLDTGDNDITDTKKKLKIRKGDLVDTKKRLEIRTGDLVDTKKMLRATDFPNPQQLLQLQKDLAAQLNGTDNYRLAYKKDPKLVSYRLKLSWKIVQQNFELKKRQRSLKVKDISKTRIKFLKDKIALIDKNKKTINKKIEDVDATLQKLLENEKITGSGDSFENRVSAEHGVDIMDKFGNPKHRLKKGAKVLTKVSSLDPNNFFEVKYDNEIYYAARDNFVIK